jgi:hypothetical protein
MGLSKSKTKTTNDPSAFAKPYITSGAGALQDAYGQTSGLASSISQNLAGQLGGLSDKAFGTDPALQSATNYNQSVTDGTYLDAGNPYLQGQIDQTNNDITDKVNSAFGSAGRTGSGANTYSLGKSLSENENNLRYTDYNNERARMSTAAGQAPSLNAAQYNGLGAYLTAAQSAVGIPQQAAGTYASGLAGLLGNYNTSTQTSSPSLGAILAQISGNVSNSIRSGAGGG